MGSLLWFSKMLLKIMKPFAKIAIFKALVDALMEVLGGEEGGEENPTDPAVPEL